MVNIQKAELESAAILSSLWTDAFKEAYHDVHSKENIENYCSANYTEAEARRILNSNVYDCSYATVNGKRVGLSVVHHQPCPLKRELKASELKQLYLLSSAYGTGLGRMMIEHAFQQIKEAKNEWVWLCVSNVNFRAQRFYQKLNFQIIGDGPELIVGTDRLTSSVMVLQLI